MIGSGKLIPKPSRLSFSVFHTTVPNQYDLQNRMKCDSPAHSLWPKISPIR